MNEILKIYFLVDLFCLILTGIILRKVAFTKTHEASESCFVWVVYSVILYLLGDFGWAVIEYCNFPGRIAVGYILMSVFYVSPALFSFCWYLFAETRINKRSAFVKNCWIAALPILILTVLAVVSACGSHVLFSYENGVYVRGPLYYLSLFLEYVASAFTVIHVIIECIHYRRTARASSVIMLLAFAAYPVIFGVLQIFFVSLPLESIGFSLALVSVMLDIKENEIMSDSLTQMNNRRCLNQYLETAVKNYNGKQQLFMMMIDVDGFKKINDTYGHLMGDEALVIVSKVLKRSVNSVNGFAARYGGDEFAMVLFADNADIIDILRKQINDDLMVMAADFGLEFPLKLSIGYIAYDPDTMLIANDFIKAADQYLYRNKEKAKAESAAAKN